MTDFDQAAVTCLIFIILALWLDDSDDSNDD